MSRPRHAKRSRSYIAVTAAVATGAVGAALPFAVASAATPSAPPGPPRTLSADALRVPAHRALKAAKAAALARYVVRPGDTLAAIARRFCGSASDYPALAANNGIANPDLIYPGQAVRIACRAAAEAFADHVAADPRRDPVTRPVPAPVTKGVTATVTSVSGVYGCSALEALWDAAGGNPADSFMAAEIATAESGGDADAISPTSDYGLWQINSSNGALATLNPLQNAKSAITLSDDGRTWSAWTTYTNNLYEGRC